jgi:hypothetical protein
MKIMSLEPLFPCVAADASVAPPSPEPALSRLHGFRETEHVVATGHEDLDQLRTKAIRWPL